MQIYLPIAEMSVDVGMILLLGGATGVLSGMFGIGGGFVLTPLLIFLGIPPTVAVASSANQIVAASVSGFLGHWRRGNVDFKMGGLLLAGGLIGSTLGVALFAQLKRAGQIDLVIAVAYVFFLGGVGLLMGAESARAILGVKKPPAQGGHGARHQRWMLYLPLKMRFQRSHVVVSALVPVAIGLIVGALVSVMGVGGGFFMVPAMIYILGMPTSVVIGTSLFQIMFVTANATLLHAVTSKTVDAVLALLLLAGAVFGAQLGARLASKLPAERLRAMLAALVLAMSAKLGVSLFAEPDDLYAVALEAVP